MITYSIIQKSQLEGAHRIDADYFQPEYLKVAKKLSEINHIRLKDISESVINFGAYSLCNYIEWKEEGIPYLNVENIKEGFIDFDNVKFIDEKANGILKKSEVKEGQVILTMAGTIGNAAVAHKIHNKVNSNQATAKITLKKGFSPYYLAAFLNSYYGKSQTNREIVSSVQSNIFLWQIKDFKVPVVSEIKQKEIETIYLNGLNELDNSKLLYTQAENLLLQELNLSSEALVKEEKNCYIVNFSDVQSANRMDAEFFQPKYEKLIKILGGNKKKLREIARRVTKLAKIDSENNYNYIQISDINISNGEVSFNVIIGKDLPANAKVPIEGNELIVSKVRPTRGAVAIIPRGWSQRFIASAAFSVFIDTSIPKEYLQVVLRSIIGKLQFEKPTTGTSYPTVTDDDIGSVYIPLVNNSVQQKIAELVKKSHEARKKSKELLEEAKRKVEDYIERDRDKKC